MLFGLVLAGLRLFAASQRVIGWILVSAAVAGLLHPLVGFLARRIPRGFAVLVVAVGVLGSLAGVGYLVVDDVAAELRALQRAAPARAAQLEEEGRFAEVAREARLEERTRSFVREVPERLRGGTPAEAFRAAATRGLAFLATGVLTLFFLLHGAKLARAAVDQVHDPRRRARLERVGLRAGKRAFGYARGALATGVLAGVVAYAVARAAGVPGPAPLALWVALWDLVPVLGAAVGAVPIIVLAAVDDPVRGAVLAVVFVAYQVVEDLVLQRWVERRTLHLGPFLTAVAAFAGLELYGLGGALLAVLAVAVAVAVLDDLADDEEPDQTSDAEVPAGASPTP